MANVSRLNPQKAAMIRTLHAEGQSYSRLARVFGCHSSLIGMVCREEIWQTRSCDGCQAVIPAARTSGLCPDCKAQFCDRCKGPKSPQRRSTRCVACDREKRALHFERRKGECSRCGEVFPAARRDYLCYECRRDEDDFYRSWKQQRALKGLVCKTEDCENLIPTAKGWTRVTCRECANKHDRLRRALSRRQCGVCGKLLGEEERGLCLVHRREDQRIAYRARKDEARRLENPALRRPALEANPCD